MMLRPVRRDL